MIGSTILNYRIEEKLGAGGMGEVYLAVDTRLQRRVALKFLPESLRHDPEARERLLREARAASQLSHPHVLTIHAVEEADGRDFIVMEYIEGQLMGEYVRTRRPSTEHILSLIEQVADGLSGAHERGIIHRDIKPSNMLITPEGRVKILDFGLAKQHGVAKITRDGSTLGTLAYSSPEQIEGYESDARSDIFSLGVVMYEMFTGRLPFEGDHQAALVYAIVHEEPAPPSQRAPAIPADVERVILRCLSKKPGHRYQSAADLLSDLRYLRTSTPSGKTLPSKAPAWTGTRLVLRLLAAAIVVLGGAYAIWQLQTPGSLSDHSGRKMLVVLPFENLGAPDQEYFADGITEEITARMVNVSGLGVISRTTAMKYKDSGKTVKEIGTELGADYVLEGTVRWDRAQEAQNVRVTPQLIRVEDDSHVWADRFERPLADIFAIQADIAERVAEAMDVTLGAAERERVTAHPTRNTASYDLYLRGNEYWNRSYEWMETNLGPAEQLYTSAIKEDSGFVAAYARLSQVYTEWFYHVERRPELLVKSKEMVDRAIQLDPDSPEARLALGSYHYHLRDYERALEQFEFVLKAQPGNGEVWMETGYVRRRQGRMRDAIACFERGTALDPGRAGFNAIYLMGDGYMWLRRYDSAALYLDRGIELIPDDGGAHLARALNEINRKSDADEALEFLDRHRGMFRLGGANIALWIRLQLLTSDTSKALERIESLRYPDDLTPQWRSFALAGQALAFRVLGSDHPRVTALCDSALRIAETEMALGGPPDVYLLSARGLACAMLGRTQEAIAAADSVVELRPLSTDAYNDLDAVETAATIYGLSGKLETAIDIVEQLLSAPSLYSGRYFSLQPTHASLRNHPRFQALVAAPDKVF